MDDRPQPTRHSDHPAHRSRRRPKMDPLLAGRRTARKTIAVLPTLLTLGNVLCGFMAIFFASRPAETKMLWDWSPLTFGAAFIFLGMVFDGLDGRVARMTRNTSDLGVQLDSMADMVTFGVAPAFLAVQLIRVQAPFVGAGVMDVYVDRLTLLIAAIYVACTALRLARFNVETKSPDVSDHMSFKGLPSPGAGGTIASLILLNQHLERRQFVDWGPDASAVVMVAVMLLVAFAMVSRIRYTHLINRYLRGRAPFGYITKAVVIGLLAVIDPQATLAAGFVAYALSGPIGWAWSRSRKTTVTSNLPSMPAEENVK